MSAKTSTSYLKKESTKKKEKEQKKKMSLSKVIIIIMVLLFALAGGLLGLLYRMEIMLARSPFLFRQTPVITFVDGRASYRKNEQADWIDAEVGSKIGKGYQVKTQRGSILDIKLHKDTVVRLNAGSFLTFDDLTIRRLTLNIKEGALHGRFHKIFKDHSINIKTPTSIAAVRGTDLYFEVAGSSLSNVYALNGITEIANPKYADQSVLLAYQSKTNIKAGSPPAQPVPMTGAEIQGMRFIINAIHSEKLLFTTGNIKFAPNTARILEESTPELEKVYKLIKDKKYKILIAGHTANVGNAKVMYNLSTERARTIKDYLVKRGIDEKRLKTKGYGGTRPIADNATDEGKAENRRVEFILLD